MGSAPSGELGEPYDPAIFRQIIDQLTKCRSAYYAQRSTGDFEIAVRRLKLELPVGQRPDGSQIARYSPPRAGKQKRSPGR